MEILFIIIVLFILISILNASHVKVITIIVFTFIVSLLIGGNK